MKPLIIQGDTGKTTLANKICAAITDRPARFTFTDDYIKIADFWHDIDLSKANQRLIIVEEVPTMTDIVKLHQLFGKVKVPIIYITQDQSNVPDGFNSIMLNRLPGFAAVVSIS